MPQFKIDAKQEKFAVRLDRKEREILARLSSEVGLKPAQFVRMLIMEAEKKAAKDRPAKMPWEK